MSPSSTSYSLCLSCLICETGTRTGAYEDLIQQMASMEACLGPTGIDSSSYGTHHPIKLGRERWPSWGGTPCVVSAPLSTAHLLQSSWLFRPRLLQCLPVQGGGFCLHGSFAWQTLRADAVKANLGPSCCWSSALRRENLELRMLRIVSLSYREVRGD